MAPTLMKELHFCEEEDQKKQERRTIQNNLMLSKLLRKRQRNNCKKNSIGWQLIAIRECLSESVPLKVSITE